MKPWFTQLHLQDDEYLSHYESLLFKKTISIRFMATNDPIGPIQTNLVNLLIDREFSWGEQAIAALLNYYKTCYPAYKEGWQLGGADSAMIEKYLPKQIDRNKLLPLISAEEIYINPEEDCSIGNFGLGLACEWDVEHGLGLSFKDWLVADVGMMDVAFDVP